MRIGWSLVPKHEFKDAEKLKPEVALCIPQGSHFVTYEWAERCRASLILPTYHTIGHYGHPIDYARDQLALRALESGAEWFLWLDSVPGTTPILLRDAVTKEIDVRPIEEIASLPPNGSLQRMPVTNLEAWDGEGWTAVRHVIRHPHKGPLVRANAVGGWVDLSPNHAVFNGAKEPFDARLIRPGTTLSWQGKRIARNPMTHKNRFFPGGGDAAWLYGFFAAEGSADEKGNLSLTNMNATRLERAQGILSRHFNLDSALVPNDKDSDVLKLEVTSVRTSRFFRERFYTSRRLKRVPREVLNAPAEIRDNFMRGYLEGDGHRDNDIHRHFRESYTTNSPALAASVSLLLGWQGKTFSVHGRSDKPTITQFAVNPTVKTRRDEWGPWKPRGLVKKVSSYQHKGYLYDLATESHRFSGGVGPFLLHNTDVIAPADIYTRLRRFNHPFVAATYYAKQMNDFDSPLFVAAWMRTPDEIKPPNERWIDGFTPIEINSDPLKNREAVEVDVVGFGCVLVHRSIFEKLMKEPYFFDYTAGIHPFGISEDFYFCRLVADKLKIRPLLDLKTRCDHAYSGKIVGGNGKRAFLGWFEGPKPAPQPPGAVAAPAAPQGPPVPVPVPLPAKAAPPIPPAPPIRVEVEVKPEVKPEGIQTAKSVLAPVPTA